MKKLVVGILAHVDAGKTTLSEALLWGAGVLSKPGRVDHGNAYLDTNTLERERGITIFSKQAELPLPAFTVTLLDTPGHVDFSSEMERTLSVLDYAILVISGTDGVQGHTRTVWELLEKHRVPTFLFVNKMDIPGADRGRIMGELRDFLSPACVDFSQTDREAFLEDVSVLDEGLMEMYLESGALEDSDIADLIARRGAFPCCFGSALKLEGVEEFLTAFQRFVRIPRYPQAFGARVFKIARDSQGGRLTYMKITGGSLKVKELLSGESRDGTPWQDKVEQLRTYSGTKYTTSQEAEAGAVVAVTGLAATWPGEGLGAEDAAFAPELQPVMGCEIRLPEGMDAHTALLKLQQLQEEDPQLHIRWNQRSQSIQLQMMGEVQLDVLKRVILERFGMAVEFTPGRVLYRETIASPCHGIGHYEPLRHYAEVHLLLEPLPRGSGLRFENKCRDDMLDKNFQHLVMTHLQEKEHLGVLTGSPLTDMKLTFLAGQTFESLTDGGDFRQATYRAVRQGLMQAESILLEPWYAFRIQVPVEAVGRVMTDIQRMGGTVEPPEALGDMQLLKGRAPVAELADYPMILAGFTRGQGRISCAPGGYEPCADQEAVVEAVDYDPQADLDNSPDSVFLSHGAACLVPWHQVPEAAHIHLSLDLDAEETAEEPAPAAPAPARAAPAAFSREEEAELQRIFERTYGPIKTRQEPMRTTPKPPQIYTPRPMGPEYLLVDGYNIIFAWEELKALARKSLDDARQALMDLLCNYQGYKKCEVILVFDAYKVKGNPGEVTKYKNIHVVYTKEAETADMYIEKTTYKLAQHRRVRVATSDGLEQLIILGHGATRIPADFFYQEVKEVEAEIRRLVEAHNHKSGPKAQPIIKHRKQD